MEKKFDFSDVSHIRRDYYGCVVSIAYKNRTWTKKILRDRLRSDADVQKAAIRVILEQHRKIQSELDSSQNLLLFSTNSKHIEGFAPRESKLISTFEHLIGANKNLDEMEIIALGKFLPKYTEQIWLRMLQNLNIKYRAQTFSTPRRARRK